jgi:hypothetical protein
MTPAQIIEGVRPMLVNGRRPIKERIRVLWAGAKMARKLGPADTIRHGFMQLAVETNLIDKRDQCPMWPSMSADTAPKT